MSTAPVTTAGIPLAMAVSTAAAELPDRTARFGVFVRADGTVTVYPPNADGSHGSNGVDLSPDIAKNVHGLLLAIASGAVR